MPNVSLEILVRGLDGMINDFGLMASPAPVEHGVSRFREAMEYRFEQTQSLVPVGTGDKRRPAGALKDSGRLETTADFGDVIEMAIKYGTDDDALPYAQWARWRHFQNTGIDYMDEYNENLAGGRDSIELIEEAMNAPFDYVWGPTHD